MMDPEGANGLIVFKNVWDFVLLLVETVNWQTYLMVQSTNMNTR